MMCIQLIAIISPLKNLYHKVFKLNDYINLYIDNVLIYFQNNQKPKAIINIVDLNFGLPSSNQKAINMGLMDFFNSIPTHMDFDGQARAENLSRIIVVLFGVVGLIWGYIIQQFSQTVYILGAGLVLATILTVPPWPLYRLKPLNWQKARPDPSEMTDSKSSKKKK